MATGPAGFTVGGRTISVSGRSGTKLAALARAFAPAALLSAASATFALAPVPETLLCPSGESSSGAQGFGDLPAPAAAAAAAAPLPSPATQEPAPGVRLRPERALGAGHGRGPNPGPVYVRADRVHGEMDVNVDLEGGVEVRHEGIVLRGERAVYTIASDELKVRGKVRLVERGAAFTGPALDFHLDAHTGKMPDASYTYAAKQGRGDSRLIEFLDDDNIRLHEATYTTCAPNDTSWWIRAQTIDINRADQEAVAHATTLYFEGVPILASPYFDLPLGDQRRSGVLTPGFYQDSRVGEEFIVPIYWNIAPNRDYTLTPDVMPRRGVALDNELRFLEPHVRGQLDYNIMPNDRTTGTMRDHMVLQTQYADYNGGTIAGPAGSASNGGGGPLTVAPTTGIVFNLNYNRVSDDNYFIDFSHNIIGSSAVVLPQEASLSYLQPYWSASLSLAKSQTLISLLLPTDSGPYERVPDLALNLHRADWKGFDLASVIDVTRFQHPAVNPFFEPPGGYPVDTAHAQHPSNTLETRDVQPFAPEFPAGYYTQDGSRLVINPSLSYPILNPGWFVTPKLQWHYTAYELDPTFNQGQTSAQRSLPIASLDTGLIFERSMNWLGKDSHQTLEPRVYYALVPYRDQNHLPDFDSTDADFNFAQLFTENTFTGNDRIAEADQVTTALTSRIVDDALGDERLRVAFGQRFYFGPQRVTLPGDVPRTNKASDTLFLASAALGRKWSFDTVLDYSELTHEFALANFGFRWQPRPASVLNLSYRYETASLAGSPVSIDQVRVSTQWPLTDRWYGVGALAYSISDRGWVESIGGVEYKASCWVGRFVVQRYAVPLPNTDAYSSSYTTVWFFQIELNGLTSVGTSPLDQLQRNISGFQRINPLSGPGGPFDHYE
jgi:LPS-assembly protein